MRSSEAATYELLVLIREFDASFRVRLDGGSAMTFLRPDG